MPTVSEPDAAAPLAAIELPASLDVAQLWARVAEEVAAFAQRHGLDVSRLVVLVPFAQQLASARQAWAQAHTAAWMPRVETTQTLAQTLVPRLSAVPGALCFDPVADGLQARLLLRAAAADWPQRDPRGFATATRQVTHAAQSLARAWLARPEAARADWVVQTRAALSALSRHAAGERALALLALEWALTASADAADALHAHQPSGWVVVAAGGRDAMGDAVAAHAQVPVLRLEADSLGPVAPRRGGVAVTTCTDFEDEAQRAAAQVLLHLQRGESPVALLALDRALVRRVRALLARQQVAIADETGWKLSTTRAGATVSGLLRAAAPQAGTDELLDWLKSATPDDGAVAALEAAWRRSGVAALRQVDATQLDAQAAALWQQWRHCSEPLRAGRAPLSDWLVRLSASLRRAGVWDALEADAAGGQLLAALRCGQPGASAAWLQAAGAGHFDLSTFHDWVDQALESVAFQPPLPSGEPEVVITPMARAVLRPFAAMVCPGADHRHLGAPAAPDPLLGRLPAELGVPTVASQQAFERQAFAQLLRAPRVTFLHRMQDGAEPLQRSALLARLLLAAEREGIDVPAAADPRSWRTLAPRPVERPVPRAPALLPAAVTATAYEDLRACPYRFFAQRMLGLADAEELDDALDKRDYGNWLHAVLQAFHQQRTPGSSAAADLALLTAIADAQQQALARGDADFLPYASWFAQLAGRYVDWVQADEARGAVVRATELQLQSAPSAADDAPPRLRGQLDRLDAIAVDGTRRLRIVDYKTSGVPTLRQRLRDPQEDTQLPFYAALLMAAEGGPAEGVDGIDAAYLALDDRDGPALLPHADVEASAAQLLDALAADFAAVREGAALPALGEAAACTHCKVRGLCRRDHWQAPQPTDADMDSTP